MTLEELKISSYLYNKFSNYDENYKNISNKDFDLSKDDDLNVILNFLREWGCRQFKKDDHKKSANALKKWFINFNSKLPNSNKYLFDMTDKEIYSFKILFDKLMNSYACAKSVKDKVVITNVGPVGAAKILFALRKNTFPPWDNPIIDSFNLSRDGTGYCLYLIMIKSYLLDLRKYFDNNNDFINMPKFINRPISSLPKIIDEYFWVSKTRKCDPSEIIDILKRPRTNS